MNLLVVERISKSFTLHVQGGASIPVMEDVSFSAASGESIALTGPSGSGKSSLMRMLYGNYRCDTGSIKVRHHDDELELVGATPWDILEVRRDTIGYISQFLRVIPRVPTLQVVAEPLRARGVEAGEAEERARQLLSRLRIPETLWPLSPVTFSGGEQQRVNIARGFAADYPVMLLDEPTASLDPANSETVIELIIEARQRGSAILGIFHDAAVRTRVCTRDIDLTDYKLAG